MNLNKVADEYGNVHYVSKKIGQGGQGAVYKTSDERLAIKVVLDANGNQVEAPEYVKSYKKNIKNISRLPIPKNLNIIKSVSVLDSVAGYVMHFLDGMESLASIFDIKKDDLRLSEAQKEVKENFLKTNPESEEVFLNFMAYFNTGGSRKRLKVMAKAASVIESLHSQALVYGDISPNNIFVSNNGDSLVVYFIDCDNIRFELNSSNVLGVYTPTFGAPEVVTGSDSTRMYSDCYSFAITVFSLLTKMHPFEGKYLDGDDEDWADFDEGQDDSDRESKVYAGKIPWIFDSEDDINFAENTSGLESIALNGDLMTLFQKTFSEGRTTPYLRPSMAFWIKALIASADKTLKCPKCEGTFYAEYFEDNKCPFCKNDVGDFFCFESYSYPNNKLMWTCFSEISQEKDYKINLASRLFYDFDNNSFDKTFLSIFVENNSYVLKNLGDAQIYISLKNKENGRFIKIGENSLQVPKSFFEDEAYLFVKNANVARLIKAKKMGGNI